MAKIAARIKGLLQPNSEQKAWVDVVFLVLFGSWFTALMANWLFVVVDTSAYKCGGPGFHDFGCAGGWEAVVSAFCGVLLVVFLFAVSFVALSRLLYRFKK